MFDRDLFGEPVIEQHKARLAARFEYPPFSVLSARDGWWQERKRQWLALGIKSELGRGEGGNAAPGGSPRPGDRAEGKTAEWFKGAKKPDARTFGQDLMRGEHSLGESKVRLAPGGGGTGCWIGGRDRPTGADAALKENRPLQTANLEGGLTHRMSIEGYRREGEETSAAQANGTSIFDPVLTELAYRWFCPPCGHVLDPFAGGSVRGIVASVLGYAYTGFELRPEQVAANRAQAGLICPEYTPRWIEGDSAEQLPAWSNGADFVFSCPPYGDLEVYSDLPGDISAMPHDEFLAAYRNIIGAACNNLKMNRFAAFVVGDFRCKKGFYRNFPGETVAAFEAAGLRYYNEAILVTAVGSLPVRTGKQFAAGRKLGKTHQQMLVFVKGDPFLAAQSCNGPETTEAEAVCA